MTIGRWCLKIQTSLGNTWVKKIVFMRPKSQIFQVKIDCMSLEPPRVTVTAVVRLLCFDFAPYAEKAARSPEKKMLNNQ